MPTSNLLYQNVEITLNFLEQEVNLTNQAKFFPCQEKKRVTFKSTVTIPKWQCISPLSMNIKIAEGELKEAFEYEDQRNNNLDKALETVIVERMVLDTT